ncbi:H(+)-transporting V0 sector ATPase subunit a [Marasmius tenuissimus]|uniref:H(+)-transporting V0 sector ATPase subunit a n=1 Tax=Marasmius tenuissimus TaxID=585030 RepID=A0ABR2ZA16_9AGAR
MDHIRRENDEVTVQVLEDTSLPIARGPLSPQSLDELEETIREREVRLTEMSNSCQKLAERKKVLLERIFVLRETVVFFDQVRISCLPVMPPGCLETPFVFTLAFDADGGQELVGPAFGKYSTSATWSTPRSGKSACGYARGIEFHYRVSESLCRVWLYLDD